MRSIVVLPGFLIIALACGPNFPTKGPGHLINSEPMTVDGGALVDVLFRVQLLCTSRGPMQNIASASGSITSPDGGVTHAQPTWSIDWHRGYDCTEQYWDRVADIHLPFVPTSAGAYMAEITLEPEVGTFQRTVNVLP